MRPLKKGEEGTGRFKLNKESKLVDNKVSSDKKRDWPEIKPVLQERMEREEFEDGKNENVSTRIVKNVIFRADPSIEPMLNKGEEALDNVFQNAVDSLEEVAQRLLSKAFFFALILLLLSFITREDISYLYGLVISG